MPYCPYTERYLQANRNNLKQKILILILFIYNFNCFAQSERILLTSEVKKRIEKNILVGRIVENLNKDNYYDQFKVNEFILDEGWELNLEYTIVNDLSFPNKDYVLFSVINDNYNTVNKREKLISQKISSHTNPNILEKEFLIAINKKDSFYIHFISGIFLKSEIAYEFELDIDNPDSFFDFLNFKLNNYKLSELKFLKMKKGNLIFECYSKTLRERIRIEVDKKEFDKIEIIK